MVENCKWDKVKEVRGIFPEEDIPGLLKEELRIN